MPKVGDFAIQTKPCVVRAENMTELWKKVNNKILWATHDELSYYSSLDTMISDCMGLAATAEFDLDIGQDLWVTPMRWNTLIRQYVDPERLYSWLEGVKQISTYNRGIAALDMNPVQRTVVASNARANRRKWGGCMRMVTYRAFPKPTVTLFSRTSYLGYIGGLDMLLANKIIEFATDMIGEGLKVSDFQFRWVCDTWQFHGFKSMAFIVASGQERLMYGKWPERKLGPVDNYPTWNLVRNWFRRIRRQDDEGLPYAEMRYGAEKRIRRRFHAQTGYDNSALVDQKHRAYPPLSTPIEEITLDRMLFKTPESRATLRKLKHKKSVEMIKTLFTDESAESILGEIGDEFELRNDPLDFGALMPDEEEEESEAV